MNWGDRQDLSMFTALDGFNDLKYLKSRLATRKKITQKSSKNQQRNIRIKLRAKE